VELECLGVLLGIVLLTAGCVQQLRIWLLNVWSQQSPINPQMAVEKLAQGIEGFAADQRKLETLLAEEAAKLGIGAA
jgi:hypothetical protein